jgi:hypothetical protein
MFPAMRTFLVVAALAGVFLLVGARAVLPDVLGNLVEDDLMQRYDPQERPEVSLEGEAPATFAGEFTGGRVEMRRPDLGGVRPERVVADLGRFDVAVLESVINGEVRFEEPPSGKMRAELSEEFLEREVSGAVDFPVESVTLGHGQMRVGTTVEALGARLPVSVAGDVAVRNGEISFKPRRLRAAGVPVPGRIGRRILGEAGFSYPIRDLPEGVSVTGGEVEEGRLVLTGELREAAFTDGG